jgi:predicted transcriptional regulator
MRTKHTFRLPPDLAGKLADYAARKHVPQALIVEAALASHLSPDGEPRRVCWRLFCLSHAATAHSSAWA